MFWNTLTMLILKTGIVLLLFPDVLCVLRNCDELVVKHGREIKAWSPDFNGVTDMSALDNIVGKRIEIMRYHE